MRDNFWKWQSRSCEQKFSLCANSFGCPLFLLMFFFSLLPEFDIFPIFRLSLCVFVCVCVLLNYILCFFLNPHSQFPPTFVFHRNQTLPWIIEYNMKYQQFVDLFIVAGVASSFCVFFLIFLHTNDNLFVN